MNTSIDDVNKFMEHIMASTNMKCLTPPSALSGDCGYLAANLYAKVCGQAGMPLAHWHAWPQLQLVVD